MHKIRWPQLAGIGVSLLFLVAAVWILLREGQHLLNYSFRLHAGWLGLSFVVECSGLLLAVPVWRQIMERFNGRLPYRDHFRIYCYSMLGIAVPGRLWSVVGRAALYKREGISGVAVALASLTELILTGLAGLVVFGVTTAVSPPTELWQRPILALIGSLLAVIFIQPPLFNRLINRLLHRFPATKDAPAIVMAYKDLIIWLGLECLVLGIGGTAVYLLLYSLAPTSIDILPTIIGAWAVATIAGSLFFWVPGPVIRDGLMTLVLAQVLPSATAVIFVILVRLWTIASILVLACLVWLWQHSPKFI